MEKQFAVKPAHETILKSVYTYSYLTAKQVCRLHYSPGSFTRVEQLLKELKDNTYLHWDFLPVKRRFGSSPAYYRLAKRGVSYLRALGFDTSILPYPSEKKEIKPIFLPHTMAVNDFLIASSRLPHFAPDITLAEMRHELLLKRTMKSPVIPDGWLDYRRGKEQICFWLEVDRGTEDVKVFRRKIRGLVTFAQTSYQTLFETPSITILFATTAGTLRFTTIRKWIEQELTEKQLTREADLFRIAAVPEGELDPLWLYFAPCWVCPFGTTALPLLTQN